MPSACDYSWPQDLDLIIREESAQAGVPLDLAYTFIAVESGFHPSARNNNPPIEDSVGLLQLNRIGGQGAGYSVAQLQDPRFNLQVGLPPIGGAYSAFWRPDAPPYEFLYLVATRSGHPGLVDRADPRIRRTFNTWACFNSGVGWAGPGGAPAPAFAIGPGAALASTIGAFGLVFLFPAGILRRMLTMVNPRFVVGQRLASLTPGGVQRRVLSMFHPRALLPGRSDVALQLLGLEPRPAGRDDRRRRRRRR